MSLRFLTNRASLQGPCILLTMFHASFMYSIDPKSLPPVKRISSPIDPALRVKTLQRSSHCRYFLFDLIISWKDDLSKILLIFYAFMHPCRNTISHAKGMTKEQRLTAL